MTDEAAPAVSDADIANFRSEHAEALESRAHPLHDQRLQELSGLFERRFAEPAEISAPAGSANEYREKHSAALLDRSHPEHDVRTQELTKIHERDAVGGDEPGESLDVPAQAEDFDFSRFKATVQAPMGEELVPDAELEQEARQWMADGGLSALEGEVMASLYSEALRWTDTDVAQIAQTTQESLAQRYGDRTQEVAKAALRVAQESGSYEFLNDSGLINHWATVDLLIRKAESNGYLKMEGTEQ